MSFVAEPARFPADYIGVVQPKLLFVLDNLTQAMYLGKRPISIVEQEPTEDEKQSPAQLTDLPIQERLLRMLQFYQEVCGKERIRVIATVRNEPGKLEKLELEQYPKLWNQFEQYELPAPDNETIVHVLADCTAQAKIVANSSEFPTIARSNDGTFRNIVENLIRARNRGIPLTNQTFEHSLDGTWKERFDHAVETYPVAIYLYDAIDLLRQVGVEIYDFTVLPTAQLLANGNFWQRQWRRQQLRIALNNLMQTERILQPRDGQIEAKGQSIAVDPYISSLSHLLLKLTDRHSQDMLNSLFGFGISLAMLKRYEDAFTSFDQAASLGQNDYKVWNNRGNALYYLGRYEEAIASYDQALQFKPDDHETWNNRGAALDSLGRYEEAINSYNEAIQFKRNFHEAWCNQGIALNALGRYKETVASYDKALQFKSDNHEAWYNRGVALGNLGRYKDAIASYDQAIEIKLDKHEAWNNRGVALDNLGRYEDAIVSYDQAIEFKPDLHEAWYNKACCYALQRDVDNAVEMLRRVIELNPECQDWAKTDADFDAIREDDRFKALIGE